MPPILNDKLFIIPFILTSFVMAQTPIPTLVYTYLGLPNLPFQSFLDDGWVPNTFDSGYGAQQIRDMTYFGPFIREMTRTFPNYKVTYPICFANVSFALYLSTIEQESQIIWPFFSTNNDSQNDILTTSVIRICADNYCDPNIEYESKRFNPGVGTWQLSIQTNKYQTGDLYTNFCFSIGQYNVSFYNCSIQCRTCSGLTEADCTQCYDNAIMNEGTCECESNYYWDQLIDCPSDDVTLCLRCLPCDSTCLECDGPLSNQCILCNGYLYDGQCVDICPNDTFINDLDNNNRSCVTICPSNSFFFISERVCIANCENSSFIGYFNDINNGTCGICNENCLTCTITSTNCIICKNDLFLWQNTCVTTCPPSTFLEISGISCGTCELTCSLCEGTSSNCSGCQNGYYLDNIANICATNCPLGFYPDIENLICEACGDYCLQCQNSSSCENCIQGYYVNVFQFCELIKPEISISVNLLPTKNPLVFSLIFNNSAIVSTTDFSQNSDVIWPEKTSFPFDFTPIESNINNGSSSCNLIFKPQNSDILSNNQIYIFILYLIDSNENYTLIPTSFSSILNLTDYASENLIKTFIDFRLFYLNNQYPIYIEFFLPNSSNETLNFSSFPAFFNQILDTSIISILDFTSFSSQLIQSFKFYNMSYIEISLNFSKSMISNAPLTFSLSPQVNFPNVSFSKTSDSIKLLDYISISVSSQDFINQTSNIMSKTTGISSSLTTCNFFLNLANLMSIRLFIMLDLLKFFKYINIKYPVNMMALFNSQLSFQSVDIMDFPFDQKDPQAEGPFLYYQISTYFLNNANVSLFQLVGSYFLGLLVLFLARKNKFFKEALELNWRQIKGKFTMGLFLKCFINVIAKLVVWNFIVAQFLSSFNENMLYVFVNYVWPPLNSSIGRINFIVATIFFIIMMIFLTFILKKIRKIREIVKKNTILPFNLSNKSPEEIKDFGNEDKENSLENRKHKDSNWDLDDFFDMSPGFTQKKSLRVGYQVIPWEKLKYMIEAETIKNNNKENSPQEIYKKRPNFLLKLPKKLEISIEETTARTKKSNNSPISIGNLKEEALFEENVIKSRYFLLFKRVNHQKAIQSYFIFLELARQFLISLFLAFCWENPIFVSISIESMNLLFFFLVLCFKPYPEKKDWIWALIGDIALNVAGIVCVFLAFMDKNQDFDYDKRMNLGWVFVVNNIALMVLLIGIFLWQLLKFLYRFYKMMGRFCRNRRKTRVFSSEKSNNLENMEKREQEKKEKKKKRKKKKKMKRKKKKRKKKNLLRKSKISEKLLKKTLKNVLKKMKLLRKPLKI